MITQLTNLASPNDHQQIPAERAIQDVKAHFISIIATTDPSFPNNCWDLHLQHTKYTLNMICPPQNSIHYSQPTLQWGDTSTKWKYLLLPLDAREYYIIDQWNKVLRQIGESRDSSSNKALITTGTAIAICHSPTALAQATPSNSSHRIHHYQNWNHLTL